MKNKQASAYSVSSAVNRELEKDLEMAMPVVRQAGKIIQKYIHQNKNIQHKGQIDLVTQADLDSEKYITEQLSELFPNDGIIAEEGFQHSGTSNYDWIIDPLDGTTSFSHNYPSFAVSVALVKQAKNNQEFSEPILGMVYAPFFDEFFYAYKNGGAYLNKTKINVSEIKDIRQSLLGTGFPYNRRDIMDELMQRLSLILHNVQDVRRTGSAALDLCYTACGRLEGYFEIGLKPWDVAAGIVIVEEAKGKVSKWNNTHFDINYPEIVVSNKLIHKDLLSLLRV